MELPKIKNDMLPKELKEILGDADAEFESIVDPMDVIDVSLDLDSYYEGRHKVATMLVESRKKLEEYQRKERHEIQRHHKGSKTDNKESEETS
ncbi:hypothetical protein S-MbCM100_201 [Synechococcus phage S-MbCM100]|jgi:hypothetical protein|uniref:Uncharacterized protein n=2 Tax=Acionnavirus monteraybay TaxID=2734078 RepID=A0A0E3HEZ5_9CAUD|nr:hypothetical protein S-MbCM100_201 [Synechococcus phage S-MbCM100]AIX14382.1 hypothetical protein Syn7803C42_197 [Synechococcus phage ACG-2014a]AHB81051.1 hypothetical protein S-MbCM100_201 [Synechococcus phage S-MbCM100]AIX15245.1 hypothetical protein Syn7803C47_196 [Synechococcus phage ACG-2014a]AIX15892.1 hypothetical protein Syn7803C53_195 [Synechococcus phage ACG-2014a]AIX17003.1 hypothetical protein Syn7803C59_196 [Synechococcus phage ACG-2014a]